MFRARLVGPAQRSRAYAGTLMRQVKSDDVFTFVTLCEVAALFPLLVVIQAGAADGGRGATPVR